MTAKLLPVRVYAQWLEWGDDEPDLLASITPADALEADLGKNTPGEEVGVYELVRIVRFVKRSPAEVRIAGQNRRRTKPKSKEHGK